MNILILKKRWEFQEVLENKKRISLNSFDIYYKRNLLNEKRFGFTSKRTLNKAHIRNKMKRRLKELVRLNTDYFISGLDYVIMCKKITLFKNLEEDLKKLKDNPIKD